MAYFPDICITLLLSCLFLFYLKHKIPLFIHCGILQGYFWHQTRFIALAPNQMVNKGAHWSTKRSNSAYFGQCSVNQSGRPYHLLAGRLLTLRARKFVYYRIIFWLLLYYHSQTIDEVHTVHTSYV